MKIDLNRKCVAQLVGKFMSWERVEERLKCYLKSVLTSRST